MGSDKRSLEADPTTESVRTLGLVAAINLVGFVIEFLGGLSFGSIALIGDALHMLFDALAYLVALLAVIVARRSSPNGQWSYGPHRIEPFAAFLNGILLVPMVALLVLESYERYLLPVAVDATMTLLLAAGGLRLFAPSTRSRNAEPHSSRLSRAEPRAVRNTQ